MILSLDEEKTKKMYWDKKRETFACTPEGSFFLPDIFKIRGLINCDLPQTQLKSLQVNLIALFKYPETR